MSFCRKVVVLVALVIICFTRVNGHGRLWEPPSRGSMWRRGYNTSININDNELSCGGFTNQWVTYGGRCGVCGDPFQQNPRDHELGGKYATGIITRVYPIGGQVDVVIGLTANHGGYFEFKLCPIRDPVFPVTEDCLDRYPLQIVSGDEGGRKFVIRDHSTEGDIQLTLQLPQHLRCKHCVLRWRYRTGSRWGCDKAKVCGKGFGPQEEFYGCSDIAVDNVKAVIYNDPLPRNDSSGNTLGLNDLGLSQTDWGKRKSKQNGHHGFQMPEGIPNVAENASTKTHKVHKYLLKSMSRKNSARKDAKSLRAQRARDVDIQKLAGLKENYVVYTPQRKRVQTKKSASAKRTVEQPVVNVNEPSESGVVMDAARKFLEDITFNAIIKYYSQGGSSQKDVSCKATLRYDKNPIVQHYCGSACVQDKFKCPALLCTCRASLNDIGRRQGEGFRNQISNNNVIDSNNQIINIGYLKKFVSNLIDRNRLLESTTVSGDLSNIPDHYIKKAATVERTTLPPVRVAGVTKPILGRVKVYGRSNQHRNHGTQMDYAVTDNSLTQDRKQFNKVMERHLAKNRSKSKEPRKNSQRNRDVPYGEVASTPPQISLFDIQTENNGDKFNSFIKSTIRKTDIANTKLASNPPNSSPNKSDVSPQVMKCTAAAEFANNPFMKNWCMANCPFGFCPTNVCLCSKANNSSLK